MIFLLIAVALSCVVIFKIAAAPIKLIFKLMLNALSGFMLLILANLISGFFDFSVPITLFSCIVSGAFGIPGVALLILIQFILM